MIRLPIAPTRLLALLVALAPLVGCASRRGVPYRYEPAEVPGILAGARAELAGEVPPEERDAEDLVDRLRSARAVQGLDPAVRREIQKALEVAAGRLIAESDDPAVLRELIHVDLPRRLPVDAGVRAARLYFEDGERMKAFRLLRELDGKFPQHHLRRESGSILADVGQDLAADDGRYGLFFRYRSLAIQVLEYFVVEYPSDPEGAHALTTLATIYEDRKYYDLAIEKHQDLLLWFPEDARAPASQAAIPRLRLAILGSPEHDRAAMLLAREECDAWLAEHPGHPLAGEVELVRIDSVRRLADNDLVVARFYRTVENPEGAEYHARRALREARDGGDFDQIEEAEELLRDVGGSVEASVTGPATVEDGA